MDGRFCLRIVCGEHSIVGEDEEPSGCGFNGDISEYVLPMFLKCTFFMTPVHIKQKTLKKIPQKSPLTKKL